jgi:hypothetical protein
VADAQIAANPDLPLAPNTNRDAPIVPKTSVELAFKNLRRGTQENTEVILALKCQQSCSVVDANSGAVRTLAAKLKFEPSTGILVGPVHLQDKSGETFLLNGSAVKVLGQVVKFRLRVRALPDAQIGSSTMRGSVRFQTVSATGVSELHTIDVTIPLRVVEHNARVETEASYLRGPSSTRVVLNVLLAPVLLLVGRVGVITGWDC